MDAPGTRRRRRTARLAGLVVALVAVVMLLASRGDRPSADEGTGSATSSTEASGSPSGTVPDGGSRGSTTTGETVAGGGTGGDDVPSGDDGPSRPAVDGTGTDGPPARALRLTLADLGAGWSPADPELAAAEPAEAFCGDDVATTGLSDHDAAAHQRSEDGPFVIGAAMTFGSERAASAYLDAVRVSAGCGSWEDGNGFANTIVAVADLTEAGAEADEAAGFRQRIEAGAVTFAADVVYLRVGSSVAVVTGLAVDATDPAVTERAVARQVDRLQAAGT